MLKMAHESGTTDIVASPHADLRYNFDPDLIRDRVLELTAISEGKPRIHVGCDFHLTFDNINDAISNPGKYTINHKNYLLVEFSDLLIFHNTDDILARMRQAGIVPVITHPERNQLLRQRLENLKDWVSEGCLIQVTAQSLSGRFGKTARQFSIQLMKLGMVHFLASDAHDTEHRPPVLTEAYEWTTKNFGEAAARLLMEENPRAAIEGMPSLTAPLGAVANSRPWFQFWR